MHLVIFGSSNHLFFSIWLDRKKKSNVHVFVKESKEEEVNERDEEEKKRRVNHEYFGPFHTHIYIQMDYLSIVCIRHLLTFFSFLYCLYFISKRANLFVLLSVLTAFKKQQQTNERNLSLFLSFFLLPQYNLIDKRPIIEIRSIVSSLMVYESTFWQLLLLMHVSNLIREPSSYTSTCSRTRIHLVWFVIPPPSSASFTIHMDESYERMIVMQNKREICHLFLFHSVFVLHSLR
jgi:hypothetical protein